MIHKTILDSREEWLEHRLNGIGGSEISAIIGCNPYMTNVDLWKYKTGQLEHEDISDKSYVKYGINAEPLLRELFKLDYPEYEVFYEENNSFKNDKYPFALASLDGWLVERETGRKGVWECKTTNILQSMQKLNYIDAGNYIPLTVVNEQVIEAAFGSKRLVNGKDEFTIVIFTKDADTGRYVAESVLLDDEGNEKTSNKIELSETKPFAVYRTAETNNLREMGEGYGLPKVYDNISLFEIVDLAFNVLFTDLEKGEKIILANDILCKYDENGNVVQSTESKKMFVLTGERLPEQNSLIHEYNPDIRIDEIRNTFETVLSLLTLRFGFGAKKYTFEDGRITTATEYIGSKQDQMQALNRQRYQSTLYITEIVNAIKAYSNMFNGTNYSLDEEVVVEYDDGYIVDKESELERKRNDAQTFDIPELLIWYLMDAYHITEEEATKLVNREPAEDDDGTEE